MQYGIKEVLDLTILNYATKKPVSFIDYALASTNEVTAERTPIKGGRGMAKLMEFDGEKESVLNVTIPLVDLSLLAHIAGDELINETTAEILQTDRLKVNDGKITLTKEPIGKVSVFEIEGLRDFGDEVDAEFTDKDGTVEGSDGKEVFAIYQYAAPKGAKEIKVRTDKFPQEVELHGKGIARSQEDGLDYPVNVTVHKARPQADFTFTMEGTEPTELELVFDMAAFKDSAGHSTYISYIFESTPEGQDTP
ncbi:hypothetical protein JOC34_000446 [Virgibacillus halotolerans]|uniref:hypothetical protein n=1 Tax=Virgibacillus halotolerans TaxID=1071053 RepID=UPI00195F4702|nr:hypothetical protein [Virgibacillus halotolerans]MBM7598089.1 hypothetical protein [Virgibacillus halotolerans]